MHVLDDVKYSRPMLKSTNVYICIFIVYIEIAFTVGLNRYMFKDVYICRCGHCWLLIKTHVLCTILSEWLTNTKRKENSKPIVYYDWHGSCYNDRKTNLFIITQYLRNRIIQKWKSLVGIYNVKSLQLNFNV